MRILLTTDLFTPSVNGVVTSVLNLCEVLTEKGHDVRILTLSPIELSYFYNDVYFIGSMKIPVYQDIRAAVRIPPDIMKDILAWSPEIVHSQCEFFTFTFAKVIAKKSKAPLVHTYHTMYENYARYIKLNERIGEKAVSCFVQTRLGKVKHIIAPTKKVADSLRDYGITSTLHIVPTGIDLVKFEKKETQETIMALKQKIGISLNSPVLISIGRLAQEKKSEELLKNFVEILKWNKNSIMLFVGDGPYREKLEHLSHSLSISDNVIFTGMIAPSDIALYYQLGTIFVAASQSETQGLTYIEALASGLPVVCRYDDCIEDVVIAGKNGFTYTTDEEYVRSVQEILGNDQMLKDMGESATLQAKRYSFARFGSDVEAIYLDCLGTTKATVARESH
ncbi:glycosyltransferase [Sphaerochaeta pleomorpha]|nr:glycosyltransferase [Sphaerochaeta pleomorpha]